MYYQFLIEDKSSELLIDVLMKKFTLLYPETTYNCKSFHGIGGFSKKNTVKETKTGHLLNDLATYLRGFNKSLQSFPSVIVVVLDNDDHNTQELQDSLESVATQNMIDVDHVFCIAVEEVEAWLLGDESAITAAYPNVKLPVLHSYEQDSICGTWEKLADAIYPGGYAKLIKNAVSYAEIGRIKAEWSKNIGAYMEFDSNKSPSFNFFFSEIKKRAEAV